MFQNILTGEVRQNPAGGRTTIDLNATSLTRTLCPPLTVPTAAQLFGSPGPGSLVFYNGFALAFGNDRYAVPEVYLERCGTHLHRLLAKAPYPGALDPPAANTHEVLFPVPSAISGLTLPGLRTFKIEVPEQLLDGNCPGPAACPGVIALTQHTLYALSYGWLWAAPANVPTSRQLKQQAR